MVVLANSHIVHADDAAESPSLFDLTLDSLLNLRVVTAASGFEQVLDDAPASVSIVNAEEWQAMGATTLLDAINHVPGVHSSTVQTGLSFDKPIIRGLSGTFGQQVLLLVDGQPFRSVRDGGTPWAGLIPLNPYKRIEIIRSPGSAIYGADAVGGIINLVSYQAGEIPSTITVRAGQMNSLDLELSSSYRWRDHNFQLAWSNSRTDGDRDRLVEADFQTWLDGQFGTNASLTPGPLENAHEVNSLRLQWQVNDFSLSYLDWRDSNAGTGAGVSQALDPEGKVNLRTRLIDASYDLSKWVEGDLKLKLAWHDVHSRVKSVLFPPGSQVPIDADGNIFFPSSADALNLVRLVSFPDGVIGLPGNDNRAISLQLNHVFNWGKGHKIRWAVGVEHTNNHADEQKNFGAGVLLPGTMVADGNLVDVTDTEYAYLPEVKRENQFISIQDQWLISDKWIGTFGIRYDRYSDFGETTNPRLGLVWHYSRKLSFKAFSGSAFRAPSFVDLYAKNNPTGLGNPDLQSESVKMFDMGFAATYLLSDTVQMEASFFQYDADNMITFVPRDKVQVAENSGALKVKGLEYSVSWRTGDHLSVDFNYALMDPYQQENIDTSSVPKHMTNICLHYRLHRFHWFVGAKWVGGRGRGSDDTRTAIEDYVWIDSRIQTEIDRWKLSLMVTNVFDEDAREPSNGLIPNDYPMPGRHWGVETSYAF